MTNKNLFPCFNMLKTNQKTIAISINPILAFFNSTYCSLPNVKCQSEYWVHSTAENSVALKTIRVKNITSVQL